MSQLADWRGEQIGVARSTGGVLAVSDPWRNVISTGIRPWPPPELIQKVYQSRQTRAFVGLEREAATSGLGFYSDLQSMHSEDAITWSAFGPVIYGTASGRVAFVRELAALLGLAGSAENANIWLWRRLPHPDKLVPGGPEIDFGIQTDDLFLLGEAKWRSSVGTGQGVDRNKDQLTLRREFCQKYGSRLLPSIRRFVVLGVSWKGSMLPAANTEVDGVSLHMRDATWEMIGRLGSHPCSEELRGYIRWKANHSVDG
jgi:hypothetical protein